MSTRHPIPALPVNTLQLDSPSAACLLPDPACVVGKCPGCGGPLVRVIRHRGGIGSVAAQECWYGMADGFGCPGERGEG